MTCTQTCCSFHNMKGESYSSQALQKAGAWAETYLTQCCTISTKLKQGLATVVALKLSESYSLQVYATRIVLADSYRLKCIMAKPTPSDKHLCKESINFRPYQGIWRGRGKMCKLNNATHSASLAWPHPFPQEREGVW